MPKRYFGYVLLHGKPYPVLYYDELPTDGNGKSTVNLKQQMEVPLELYNKELTQLSIIYPYQQEGKENGSHNERFKI
jgi:hypothetical protein